MARFDKPPRSWEALESGYPRPIYDLARELDTIILRAVPDLVAAVRGAKMMAYVNYELAGIDGVLLRLSPEDDHVKLYVHHIREDTTGSLDVEGTGKSARHVKFRAAPDKNAVVALVEQEIGAARK